MYENKQQATIGEVIQQNTGIAEELNTRKIPRFGPNAE
jgi:hypothetical protein